MSRRNPSYASWGDPKHGKMGYGRRKPKGWRRGERRRKAKERKEAFAAKQQDNIRRMAAEEHCRQITEEKERCTESRRLKREVCTIKDWLVVKKA